MKKGIYTIPLLTLVLALGLMAGCSKAARQERMIKRADADFAAGRYESAEIGYRGAAKLAPPTPELWVKLGRVYHAQGRWLESIQYLRASLKTLTNDWQSRLLLGEAALAAGNFDEAFTQGEQVLRSQPGHPEAMVLLASSVLSNTGVLTNATQLIANQPESAKGTAAYRIANGILLSRIHKEDLAETEFKAALSKDSKAIRAHLGLASLSAAQYQEAQEKVSALAALDQTKASTRTALDQAKASALAALDKAKASARAALAVLPKRSFWTTACLESMSLLGEQDEAKQVAQDMLRQNQDFFPPYIYLARQAVREGRTDDGVALMRTALGKARDDIELLTALGDLYLSKGDGTNALSSFQQASSRYDQAPPGLSYSRGLARIGMRDFAGAQEDFRKALRIGTNSIFPRAALALGQLATEQRATSEAQSLISDFNRLIEQEPQLLEARTVLSDLYLLTGDSEGAIQTLVRAQQVFTNNAELYYRLGSVYRQVRRTSEAGKMLSTAHDLQQTNLFFLNEWVQFQIDEGSFEDAQRVISNSLSNNPGVPLLNYLQGAVYVKGAKDAPRNGEAIRLERINAAEASFKKAIDLAPLYERAWLALAQLYVDTDRRAQGLQELQTLLARTNLPTARLVSARYLEQDKQYAESAAQYQKILDTDQTPPVRMIALNNLACLYADHLGDLAKAYTLAAEARRIAPKSAFVAESLGWISCKKGDYAGALTLLEEAGGADPSLARKPEYLYHLGSVNYLTGAESKAQDLYRKALETAEQEAKVETTGLTGRLIKNTMPTWEQEVRARLANLAMDVSTPNAAIEAELQKRVIESPEDPVLLVRWVVVQQRRGDYEGALKTCESVLKRLPNNKRALCETAWLYAVPLKDPTRGLEYANRAYKIASNDPLVVKTLGRVAFRTGDYKTAVARLKESVENYPADAALNFELGSALYRMGRVGEAEAALRKAANAAGSAKEGEEAKQFLALVAAAKDPAKQPELVTKAKAVLANQPDYLPALVLLGAESSARGAYSEAAEYYGNVLKQSPTFSPAARGLGMIYFKQIPNADKAYELLNGVRDEYAEDGEFTQALGILACKRGDYENAARMLQANGGAQTEDPQTLFYLGKAQFNMKRIPEARRVLERALKSTLPKELELEARKMIANPS